MLDVEEISPMVHGLTINVISYPNPFSSSTTIEYNLQHTSTAQITIYYHFGEQIEVIQQNQSSGQQQVVWNAKGLPSGMYYFTLQAGEQRASGKMVVVR